MPPEFPWIPSAARISHAQLSDLQNRCWCVFVVMSHGYPYYPTRSQCVGVTPPPCRSIIGCRQSYSCVIKPSARLFPISRFCICQVMNKNVILKCAYLFKKMPNLKALEYSQHEYEGSFPRVPKRVLHPQGFWRTCPVLHLLRWRCPISLAHSPTSRPVFGQSKHPIGGTLVVGFDNKFF